MYLIENARLGAAVTIAGKAGMQPVAPNAALMQRFGALRGRGERVLLYPDGGDESTKSRPMLVQSILRSEVRIVLVPMIHPKFKNAMHPSGSGTWFTWIMNVVQRLRDRDQVLDISAPIEEVADSVDGVASCYGTPIFRPAIAGRLALTLWDEVIAAQLKLETGLDQTPLMFAGYPVLSEE